MNDTVKEGQDLSAEIAQYEDVKFYIDSGHWTSHPVFASRERHWMAYAIEKIRFYGYLSKYVSLKPYDKKAKILIAPIGNGNETVYLQGMYSEICGMDISERALSQCPAHISTKKVNILHSGGGAEIFDIILCPLFLHHVHKVGFTPFLKEYYRLLRPGGILAIHEPGILFPPSQIAALLRFFMGDVTGLVDDERPIFPPALTKCLKKNGFVRIKNRGLSFSHCRYPIILQSMLIAMDWPLRILWPFKLFANGIGWYCEKPMG